MRGWIVDTNVLSELRKPRCSPHVRAWTEAQAEPTLFVSCVTLAEIRFGIERLDAGSEFRRTLKAWLDDGLRAWFEGRVLDIDERVVLTWRHLVDAARARRHTYPQPDLFIAATALVHGLGVATRNTADFLAAGVTVRNPWEPA